MVYALLKSTSTNQWLYALMDISRHSVVNFLEVDPLSKLDLVEKLA